jgi:pimeloyl-ACP methyl ester carboxylesterase
MPTTNRPDPLVDPDHRASRSADREARSRAGRVDIEDADQQAPLVLLIGGPPESSLIRTRIQPLLLGDGLRVLSIGASGSRRGNRPGARLDDNAAAMARILDDRHGSPEVVVAHSLGAGTALALATSAAHTYTRWCWNRPPRRLRTCRYYLDMPVHPPGNDGRSGEFPPNARPSTRYRKEP